jgi:NAD(P)-dependent dehydrogenase (short-subunit alcohol dehydrogenase family)
MLAEKRLGLLGEPPPRRLTRQLLGLPPSDALDAASVAAHFGFGATVGGAFALLPSRARATGGGALFGLAVWAANYAGWLPAIGLMPPPAKDRPGRPTAMALSHLVYGAVLALSERALARDDYTLRGKVAIVGGGSRGLGRAIAQELLKKGARVAICGRSAETLEQARLALETPETPLLTEVCDLRREGQTLAFFERVEQELGPIDIVVANAATIEVAPLEVLTPTDFDQAMSEIFGTSVRAALTALPSMRRRRTGTIALIASIGGKVGLPHLAAYSSAKFAVVGFAEALQAELAKDGIRVLTVLPGLMRTGSHLHAQFRGQHERELTWFGASAILPIVSIDADLAARRIVRAIARGDRHLTFTPAARLATWLHDAAPNAWSLLASLAGRLLPRAAGGDDWRYVAREGEEIIESSGSRIVGLIGRHSASLATRYGQ